MKLNRFLDKDVFEGQAASDLLDNEVFQQAVRDVLDRYAETEEKLLLDNDVEVRDVSARIRANAMMRRAVLDVVNELNTYCRKARNEKYRQTK